MSSNSLAAGADETELSTAVETTSTGGKKTQHNLKGQ